MTASTSRRVFLGALAAVAAVGAQAEAASVDDLQRELGRMIGFTIYGTDTVQAVANEADGRRFTLTRHGAFREFGPAKIAAPAPNTPVLVFVRRLTAGVSAPPAERRDLYNYRLLVGGEFVTVSPV